MRVKTGKYEVLDSVSFIAPTLGESSLRIEGEGEAIDVVLEIDAHPEASQSVRFESPDSSTLRIVATNWNNSFPTTFKEPARVGTLGQRELFIMLSVTKLGSLGDISHVILTSYLGGQLNGPR